MVILTGMVKNLSIVLLIAFAGQGNLVTFSFSMAVVLFQIASDSYLLVPPCVFNNSITASITLL